jgi:transcriptional regulator with XRE-family HTH domain
MKDWVWSREGRVQFARDVRAMRERRGLTRTQLGRELGVSSCAVGNWEHGSKPHPKNLRALKLMWSAKDAKATDSAEEGLLSALSATLDNVITELTQLKIALALLHRELR